MKERPTIEINLPITPTKDPQILVTFSHRRMLYILTNVWVLSEWLPKLLYSSMLTTPEKHNPGFQRVARLEGQSSTGYDWERAVNYQFDIGLYSKFCRNL